MAHEWTFFRAGGVDQVVIQSGADIAHLGELDQKLWVALACPTRGIEFDTRTLDLIDTNHDGRIRAPELVAAAAWACARLKDPDDLVRGGDSLHLAAIADADEPGQALVREARHVLQLLGKPDADAVTLADVKDRGKLLAAMRFNGDGVVTAATAQDDELRQTLQLVIDKRGPTQDRNGEPGIDRKQAEAFFADAAAIAAWYDKAAHEPGITPLDDSDIALPDDSNIALPAQASLAAAEALSAVEAKVDDYFARCRVAAYDERAIPALNASLDDYQSLGAHALTMSSSALAELPLAPIQAGRALPLHEGVNPYWSQALWALKTRVADPLLGTPLMTLSEAHWAQLKQRLAPCLAWLAARPVNALSDLPPERIAHLAAADTRAAVFALIDSDEAAAAQNELIADLEKLLVLQRDLLKLLHNFVSFQAFYHRQGAIFQAGTLFLDGRSCDLSVQVADTAKHALLAGMAKAYLAYCECTREGQKMNIVSAFTAGDVDFLFVGRNGIFYDRQGRDWDATITKVIENPTSIAQAFLSPYKKFLRLIEEQVAKRAAASDTLQQSSLSALAGQVVNVDKGQGAAAGAAAAAGTASTTTPAARKLSRWDVGAVAALGVALGSFSALLVGLFGKFIELGWWIPVALVGIVMAISGPSMLIAWLKLRQRSLGPILDACGWAVNGRMRVNVRLGASLSQTAHVPASAVRTLRDPFAERHGVGYLLGALALVGAVVLVAWRYELLNPLLPEPLRVLPAAAPASAVAPAASNATSNALPSGP